MKPSEFPIPDLDTAKVVFDTMPRFLYFLKDRNQRFVALNKFLAEKMGYPESEIIGKTDYDFFPKPMADAFYKDDQEILKKKTPLINKIELVPSNKGKADWSLTSKIPILGEDGEVKLIVGITRPFSTSDTAQNSTTELKSAIEYIENHYDQKISVPHLAKISGLSVSAFERKFKKVFHTTPSKYITHTRIQQACHLLSHTSVELVVIAEETGFYDQSHFSREFTKSLNVSPLQYRKQYRI